MATTTNVATTSAPDTSDVQNGLEFILSHLSGPHFPRNIMTHRIGGQILVHSIEEAMQYYKESEFLDCRISAYPPQPPTNSYIFLGNGFAPNLIMIDIDKSRFTTERAYELAVSKTLKIIKVELNGDATVIWSGNGYHIIQPIDAIVLEELDLFSPAVTGTDQPSVNFLRWAEKYLSNGKSDPMHNKTISFGNCLLRVPGSHNSKCVKANNGIFIPDKTSVKIVQRWNGVRPTIMQLIGSFHAHLVNQKMKNKRQQRLFHKCDTITGAPPATRLWIEKLLTMSLHDCRKYCIWRILAPYLINVIKLSDEQALYTIREWLKKCGSVKRISFDAPSRIRYDIQSARRRGFYPISWNQLKTENVFLYNFINK
jgi:Primase X